MNKTEYKGKCLNCGRPRKFTDIDKCSTCKEKEKQKLAYRSPLKAIGLTVRSSIKTKKYKPVSPVVILKADTKKDSVKAFTYLCNPPRAKYGVYGWKSIDIPRDENGKI